MSERQKQHHGRSEGDDTEVRNAPPRDPYRDNDDMRDPLPEQERIEVAPDSKSEARGNARENVGNNRRGTDAGPTGPEGNDKQKRRE